MPKRLKTGRFHLSFGLGLIEKFALEGKSVMDETDSDTGQTRQLTPAECLGLVREYQAKGFEVYPSPDCNNYDKTGRCLGHKE